VGFVVLCSSELGISLAGITCEKGMDVKLLTLVPGLGPRC